MKVSLTFCAATLLLLHFTAQGADSRPGLLTDWLQKTVPAATAWDVGGQFRLRYEDRENAGAFPNRDFIRSGQMNSDDYLLFRERLHLGYAPQSWISFFVEGRDSRALFDQRDPSPDHDTLDLHQAFVTLGDPRQFPVSAKVGRQELAYGDERFIGTSDWSNTGRVFDAAKVRFENQFLWADAFAGRVVLPYDDHFNEANDYDLFTGVYASSQSLAPWQETQLFFLARTVSGKSPSAIALGVGGPGARDIYTAGLRFRSLPGKLAGWDYGAEFARQFGSINSGARRIDHDALAANVLAGYTCTNFWGLPRLGVEYTYASGDRNPNDGVHETFDLLFGTNHKPYGAMDLFGLRNVHMPSANLTVKPATSLSLRAEYLLFWLADTGDFLYPESAAGRSGNGYGLHPGFGSFVGSELDVIASYQPRSWAELQCGYGRFFVGDYIRQSVRTVPANGGAVDANWVYVQAKFAF